MRLLIIAILSSFVLLSFDKPESPDQEEEGYFVILYTLGESWDQSKPPGEQDYFSEHSMHLSNLRKAGDIVVGARYSDTGMLILKGQSLEEAESLIKSDIAVQKKLFNVEIHQMSPFYTGCVEN